MGQPCASGLLRRSASLPSHVGADGSVDLRRHFAHPVPMQVICELLGVPSEERPRLQELMDNIFRSDLRP